MIDDDDRAMQFFTSDVHQAITKASRGDVLLSRKTLQSIEEKYPMSPVGWCVRFTKTYLGKVMSLRIESVDALDGSEFAKGWLLTGITREDWKPIKIRFHSPTGVPDHLTELKLLVLL